jgi:hypothetical protein
MMSEAYFISELDEPESLAEQKFGHFHLIPAVRQHQKC